MSSAPKVNVVHVSLDRWLYCSYPDHDKLIRVNLNSYNGEWEIIGVKPEKQQEEKEKFLEALSGTKKEMIQ